MSRRHALINCMLTVGYYNLIIFIAYDEKNVNCCHLTNGFLYLNRDKQGAINSRGLLSEMPIILKLHKILFTVLIYTCSSSLLNYICKRFLFLVMKIITSWV